MEVAMSRYGPVVSGAAVLLLAAAALWLAPPAAGTFGNRADDTTADARDEVEDGVTDDTGDKGDQADDADEGDPKDKDKDKAPRPRPSPKLTPGQVVRIVMDALQHNDEDDSGIAVTFDFASPANREVTGPLERFAQMVKNPAYGPMLNYKSAEYGKAVVVDDQAQQVVKIVAADDEVAVYVFRLSKQPDGEYEGCWMTDGVIRVQEGEEGGEPKEPPTPVSDAPRGSNGRYKA
jgi:hypothetical protein